MLSSCICGVSSLPKEDDFHFLSRSKSSKNPFAARGLGEFLALLAKIEDQRKKIYEQFGPEEISLIHFVFSSDNSCKPIVVKAMKGKGEPKSAVFPAKHHRFEPPVGSAPAAPKEEKQRNTKGEEKKVLNLKGLELDRLRLQQPCYYLSVIFMLALLLLAFFGRTGTVLCTTIGWYAVPSITDRSVDARRLSMKKIDDGKRRLGEKEKKISHQGKFSFKGFDAVKTSHGGHGRRGLVRSVTLC